MATPIVQIDNIYFKREDTNITGSIKDRSVPIQLKNISSQGIYKAVISSTGNAAISASFFAHKYNIDLTIFVSPKVNQNKLRLLDYSAVIKSHTPVSDAFKYAKDTNSFYLRQSTDPIAQKAYSIVGEEINTQLPSCTSIFLPVGSGSTLVGIAQKLAPQTKIFSVQPANHAPISSKFDHNFTPETNSVTDALSVKYLPLKTKVIQAITNSNGSGLVIQDSQVIMAHKWLKDHDVNTSPEGALALAGFYKAKNIGLDVGDCPLIILTGTNRE